jgi:tRNA-dihydrouridine synthase A
MMRVTDRHCRYFLRQIAPEAFLYTEMIPVGALLHGDPARSLAFSPEEHPVAAQLGGADPRELARCARLVERYGYDEVNLNLGCPSERVRRGTFGACLMAEPARVADCVRAMRSAVQIPVSVKHRLGLGLVEDYGFVRDFVGRLAEAGVRTFIVHARNAILGGLTPKQNREVPPLRHAEVHRLKADFPHLEIVLNGGLATREAIAAHLARVDGVMLGRAAARDPWLLAPPGASRAAVVREMHRYAVRMVARGCALKHIVRPMLGLYHGHPGARRWRQMLSDPRRLAQNDPGLLLEALDAVEAGAGQAARCAEAAGVRV